MNLIEVGHDNICKECGNLIISDSRRAQMACTVCGLISSEREIDTSQSGKRAFNNDEANKRVHSSPMNINKRTIIPVNETKNPELRRASKWQHTRTPKQLKRDIGYVEIKRIVGNENLSYSIVDSAMILFDKVCKSNDLKRNNVKGTAIACLFHACQKNNSYRSIEELNDNPDINNHRIWRIYSKMAQIFKLKISLPDPLSYILRFIPELGIDPCLLEKMKDVLSQYKKNTVVSAKNSKGIAAGVIYTVCMIDNRNITQEKIAEVAKVSTVTLRKRYKEIIKHLKLA